MNGYDAPTNQFAQLYNGGPKFIHPGQMGISVSSSGSVHVTVSFDTLMVSQP